MKRRVAVVLVLTFVALVGATLWVPITYANAEPGLILDGVADHRPLWALHLHDPDDEWHRHPPSPSNWCRNCLGGVGAERISWPAFGIYASVIVSLGGLLALVLRTRQARGVA